MKTKIELMAMTIAELRKEASNQKVKNYGKLSKTELIEAVSASYEEKSQDESFTDSKGEVIQKGDKVSVRIGNKLFPGTISGMKKIENDQYVHVMLDGNDKTKMFHTGDVIKSKEDMLVKKPNGGVMYIAPEVSGENSSNTDNSIGEVSVAQPKQSKPKSEEPKPKEPKSVDEFGFPVTKYHDKLAGQNPDNLRKGDKVLFENPKTAKVDAGKIMYGILKTFYWDVQGNCSYFGVMCDGKLSFKRPTAVKLVK